MARVLRECEGRMTGGEAEGEGAAGEAAERRAEAAGEGAAGEAARRRALA